MAVGGRKVVCVDLGHPTTTFELEKGEPEKGTAVMVVDAQDAVWVAYSNGEVFRIQEGKARLFTAEDGLSEGRECRLTLDVAGRLWFLRGEWVGVFRDGKFHALERLGPQRIAAARSGGIWCWGGGNLWKFSEDGSRVLVGKPPPELAEASPPALYENRDGQLLIGTSEARLHRFDGTALTPVKGAHQTVLSLAEDREGNLWVGTRGGGLTQLRPRTGDLLTTSATAPFEAVRSVAQDAAATGTSQVTGVVSTLTLAGATLAFSVSATNNP